MRWLLPALPQEPPTATPISLFFPVTTDEWRNELERRGTAMTATVAPCWWYIPAGEYRIGGWSEDEDNDPSVFIRVYLYFVWLFGGRKMEVMAGVEPA